MILLACVFAAGCLIPGTTPDPIVGSWEVDDPMQFNDLIFTFIFHEDGTGEVVEIDADSPETVWNYNLSWKPTGKGTYEAIVLYDLVMSEDEKILTIPDEEPGIRFLGDGFIGVWTMETPEEFDGVLYEERLVFYENRSGVFSWYYLNNSTLKSSYPLVWSVENGVYQYSYPDDLSTLTIGDDGVLTEKWGDGIYTYTRV